MAQFPSKYCECGRFSTGGYVDGNQAKCSRCRLPFKTQVATSKKPIGRQKAMIREDLIEQALYEAYKADPKWAISSKAIRAAIEYYVEASKQQPSLTEQPIGLPDYSPAFIRWFDETFGIAPSCMGIEAKNVWEGWQGAISQMANAKEQEPKQQPSLTEQGDEVTEFQRLLDELARLNYEVGYLDAKNTPDEAKIRCRDKTQEQLASLLRSLNQEPKQQPAAPVGDDVENKVSNDELMKAMLEIIEVRKMIWNQPTGGDGFALIKRYGESLIFAINELMTRREQAAMPDNTPLIRQLVEALDSLRGFYGSKYRDEYTKIVTDGQAYLQQREGKQHG